MVAVVVEIHRKTTAQAKLVVLAKGLHCPPFGKGIFEIWALHILNIIKFA
jgi:hypothetical protein